MIRSLPASVVVIPFVALLGSVSPAAEPGCPGSEAPDPAILHCDDFDDGVAIAKKWNAYSSSNAAFVPVEGTGVSGTTAMRVRFDRGQIDAGRFSIGLGRLPEFYLGGGEDWKHVVSPATVFREIYWREYVRFEPGWSGVPYKHARLRVLVPPDPDDPAPHRTAFQAHFWPDTNPNNPFLDGVLFFNNTRGVDPAGKVIDRGNNTGTSIWLPRTPGVTVVFGGGVQERRWICIEAHVRLNDPGAANGIEEFWLDGRLDARRSDQDHVGTYTDYGLNQLVFDNYWNGGAPQTNVLYRDNMVVSMRRIGCLEAAPDVRAPDPTLLLP